MMQNMQDAGVAAVGRTLSQARASRGLSLDDVERDTRIAKRYLEALEHDEFDILPAPVYCRAFIRTYAQYLGLNPNEVLRVVPENGPVSGPAQIAPLPQVAKAPPPALSMNWIIAGGVVLVFVLAGALLYKMGSGSNEPDTSGKTSASVLATQPAGQGAEPVNPNEVLQPTASYVEGQPVSVPDLTGETGLGALPKVVQAGLNYVVFQLYDDETPKGFIISQSPAPNVEALTGDPVTLVISRGPRQ